MQGLSSLPALTSLDLRKCYNVTADCVQALCNTTAASYLHIVVSRFSLKETYECYLLSATPYSYDTARVVLYTRS
jgi:hypothetical protein